MGTWFILLFLIISMLLHFKKDMEGIYSKNTDRNHLDECPKAYKNIDKVMENQKDLIDIVWELKPVFNIKG